MNAKETSHCARIVAMRNIPRAGDDWVINGAYCLRAQSTSHEIQTAEWLQMLRTCRGGQP